MLAGLSFLQGHNRAHLGLGTQLYKNNIDMSTVAAKGHKVPQLLHANAPSVMDADGISAILDTGRERTQAGCFHASYRRGGNVKRSLVIYHVDKCS